MSTRLRCIVGSLLLAILLSGGISLVHGGIYGWTIFMVSPVLLGGIASLVYRPATGAEAAKIGALSVAVALGSYLVLGLEGLICVGMTLPLAVPLGALGSWLVYRAERSRSATRGGIAILLLMPPASLT